MALPVFADSDGLLLVEVLLLMQAPVVGVHLVHLASAILKVFSTEPLTKTENFLEGLLELRGMLIVWLQASNKSST